MADTISFDGSIYLETDTIYTGEYSNCWCEVYAYNFRWQPYYEGSASVVWFDYKIYAANDGTKGSSGYPGGAWRGIRLETDLYATIYDNTVSSGSVYYGEDEWGGVHTLYKEGTDFFYVNDSTTTRGLRARSLFYWGAGSENNWDYYAPYASKSVTFNIPMRKITVKANSTEKGSVSGNATVRWGRKSTISATPNTGYIFSQWDDNSKEQTRDVYIQNDTTFTAIFVGQEVKYNYYDGNAKLSSSVGRYGENYNLTLLPTKTGYRFLGWYDAISGGNLITNETKINTTSEHNLYAHWEKIEYTVTFNYGDVRRQQEWPETATVTYGKKYGNALPYPTVDGYSSIAWSLKEDDERYIVNSNTTVITSSNHTLYAIWTPKEYTVTFNYMGGEGDIPSKKVLYGRYYGMLPWPTKLGCAFGGWYKDSSYTSPEIVEYTYVNVASNHTLYAKWDVTANCFIKTNNEWKLSVAYIKQDGEWKLAVPHIKQNGVWKKWN